MSLIRSSALVLGLALLLFCGEIDADDAAPRRAELVGRVLREVDGLLEPVAGVTVTGVIINQQSNADLTDVTNRDGEFSFTWQPGKLLLHALTDDGEWGITRMLQGQPDELDLVLLPTTSASGQVLDAVEGQPIAGFKFDYQIDIDLGDGLSTSRFGGKAETDDEGLFALEHLIQGQTFRCYHHLGFYYFDVCDVTALDATPIDLGQLPFDSDERNRTPSERLEEAFQKTPDADRHFQIALEEAGFQRQNVLLIVGDREDQSVRNLFRLFFEEFDFWDERRDTPLRRRLHDFELCALEAPRVVESGGVPGEILAASAGDLPMLFVLNPDGVLLGSLSTESWVADDATLDESAILALLDAHLPEVLDAEQLLEDVLVEASTHDPPRRILVHEVDTLLARSRKLTRFLVHNADTLGEHCCYFPVDPVRMPNGYELLDALASDQYSNDEGKGRPSSWVGLMTADGELLGSVTFEGGGLEFRPHELDQFVDLLRNHIPGIIEEQLAAWREAMQLTQPYGLQ